MICDHLGCVLQASMKAINHRYEIKFLEVMVVFEVLSQVLETFNGKVFVETDCLEAVNFLNNQLIYFAKVTFVGQNFET